MSILKDNYKDVFSEKPFSIDYSLLRNVFFYNKKYLEKFEPWLLKSWNICINLIKDKRGLVENRLLGLIFLFDKISTEEIVESYNKWFGPLSRSTISYYLNGLVKENILIKEKLGRQVIFSLNNIARIGKINPFWFTRNICPTPRYLYRTAYFTRPIIATLKLDKEIEFLLQLIILNLLKNKYEKCSYCPYSDRNSIKKIISEINNKFNNRTIHLKQDLMKSITNYGELMIFGGKNIVYSLSGERIPKELVNLVRNFKKDINLQMEFNKFSNR